MDGLLHSPVGGIPQGTCGTVHISQCGRETLKKENCTLCGEQRVQPLHPENFVHRFGDASNGQP